MLDLSTLPPAMSPAWRDHLAAGQIVSFVFPHADEAFDEPKARPCLVLSITRDGDDAFALIAYGTTSSRHTDPRLDIAVPDRRVLPVGGLDQPTTFQAGRRLLVHLRNAGFMERILTGSPVIGRLTGATLARLDGVRAALLADEARGRARRAKRRQTGAARHRPWLAVRGREAPQVERRRSRRVVLPGRRLVPDGTLRSGPGPATPATLDVSTPHARTTASETMLPTFGSATAPMAPDLGAQPPGSSSEGRPSRARPVLSLPSPTRSAQGDRT